MIIPTEQRSPEIVGPDPVLIKLAHRIMDQNGQILAMNSDLMKVLSNPVIILRDEKP